MGLTYRFSSVIIMMLVVSHDLNFFPHCSKLLDDEVYNRQLADCGPLANYIIIAMHIITAAVMPNEHCCISGASMYL